MYGFHLARGSRVGNQSISFMMIILICITMLKMSKIIQAYYYDDEVQEIDVSFFSDA